MMIATGQNRLAKDLQCLLKDRSPASLDGQSSKSHCDFGVRCTIREKTKSRLCLVFYFPSSWFGNTTFRQKTEDALVDLLKEKLPQANISDVVKEKLQIDFSLVPTAPTRDRSVGVVSRMRLWALGMPILLGFQSLLSNDSSCEDQTAICVPLQIHKTHPGATNGFSMMEVTSQKVTIAFKVEFEDEIERALARLLLQELARNKAFSSHYCEYRKQWKAVEESMKKCAGSESPTNTEDKSSSAGIIVFSIFPNHVKQLRDINSGWSCCDSKLEESAFRFVNLMVNMDASIKHSKTFMRSRMREKKRILMKPLALKVTKNTVWGTITGRQGLPRSPGRRGLGVGSPGRRPTSPGLRQVAVASGSTDTTMACKTSEKQVFSRA
ncbi:expressed unknown protein [Seminavis robusta]|uniref:Arp2/3 complex 34 kDa subunit n=1 Tax=Seminavis robusta TaxID=568900 RepID=A0A9N8H3L1_9STRA|nr:expressed unknown protein [Seminavis robusta]|eukprot:Sro63_g035940.1 n/a (381) ;mRNA; r:94127-95364